MKHLISLELCTVIATVYTVILMVFITIPTGCGTLFNHKQVSTHDLKKMVHDRIIVKLRDRYYSNTSQLGQVLMETMLREVSEFCKINIQQSWATQAHQQVLISL